ncbi:hypothetical protein N665_0015s0041 [Sinapis alba]|nr:hypothetical protein N665_0015s0041 [Sinapis alba]
MNMSGIGEERVICLSDFVSGEKLRLLPKCNQGFHVCCIDKWLEQHLTCPKCRHSDQVTAPASKESVIVRISPLEPEGRVNTFRESN